MRLTFLPTPGYVDAAFASPISQSLPVPDCSNFTAVAASATLSRLRGIDSKAEVLPLPSTPLDFHVFSQLPFLPGPILRARGPKFYSLLQIRNRLRKDNAAHLRPRVPPPEDAS